MSIKDTDNENRMLEETLQRGLRLLHLLTHAHFWSYDQHVAVIFVHTAPRRLSLLAVRIATIKRARPWLQGCPDRS